MIRKAAFILSLVLIFTIPWETAVTISTLGTLTRLIGVAAAGIWVVSMLLQGKFRKFNAYHVAVLVFMLYNLASIYWTASLDLTMTRVKTYLQLALLAWLLWDLFTTPAALRLGMQAFIFGAYVTIASQLINFVSGQTISAYNEGRFTGAGQNAVELALILSLSLPLAWHLATTQQPGQQTGRGAKILRIVNYSYIPLALLATILTASRTSLVTNVPGLIYMAWTMRKLKMSNRVLIFLLLTIAFAVIWPYIPSATLSRLSTIGSSISESDLGGRTRLWKGALEIFSEHPVLGIGSNALGSPGQLGAYAHNTFFSILAELGLVGFMLFAAILVIVVYQALRQPGAYSALWMTVIFIWIIGVLSLTWEYTKPTWFFFTLIVISAGIHRRQEQSAEDPSIAPAELTKLDIPVA